MTRPRALFARLCGWLLLAFVLVVAVAAPASAHATLASTNPVDGSVLKLAPSTVSITFDESVGVGSGSLRVYDPAGARVDVAAPVQSRAGTEMTVHLRTGLGDGTYTVAWHVVSADSHPVSGAFTFSIGHRSTHVSTASVQGSTGLPVQIVYAVTRGLGFLAFAVFCGGVTFLLVCWPDGAADLRARRLLATAWSVAMGTALLAFLLQGVYATAHGFPGMVDPTLLKRTLDSRLGACLLARVVLLLQAGFFAYVILEGLPGTRRAHKPVSLAAWAVASGSIAATWSLAGHASVGRYIALAIGSDVIHLVAASVWIGGLCVLAATALRGRDVWPAWEAVRRFSPIALGSVAVVIVTGTLQTLRDSGHLAALLHTTYGWLIVGKVIGLIVLMGLGYAARGAITVFFVDQPPEVGEDHAPAVALRRLRRSVAGEVVVAVAVLGLTAVLVNTATAREAYTPIASTSEAFDTGTVQGTVQVVVTPATLGPQVVHLTVKNHTGQPYGPTQIGAALTLPQQGIGPLALHLSSQGEGRYSTTATPVGIAGTWTVGVTIRSGAFDETTVTAPVTIR
jgi:copper transport protein